MLKYSVFATAVIAAFAAAPLLLLDIPETASTRGIAFAIVERSATVVVALVFGCVGLLYKPNRFAGVVGATALAGIFMWLGQS